MLFSFVYTTPWLLENRYVQKIGCNLILFTKIFYKTAKLKKNINMSNSLEIKKDVKFILYLKDL